MKKTKRKGWRVNPAWRRAGYVVVFAGAGWPSISEPWADPGALRVAHPGSLRILPRYVRRKK